VLIMHRLHEDDLVGHVLAQEDWEIVRLPAIAEEARRSSSTACWSWMGATHFLTQTLKRVSTEMSLHVLAYNLKRVIAILGVSPLIAAIRT
jgi:hypothetical protein